MGLFTQEVLERRFAKIIPITDTTEEGSNFEVAQCLLSFTTSSEVQ